MKRTLSILSLGLLMLAPISAQNYKIQTDSMAKAMVEENHRTRKVASYRICADSLRRYIHSNYTNGGNMNGSSYSCQIIAPVCGSDEKLRRVVSNVIDELSRFPYLQKYSEQIDDGATFRGRYIVKLRPELRDTSAYFFLKYDRNLIVLNQSSDIKLKMPAKTIAAPRSTTSDEVLSVWKSLKEHFYITAHSDAMIGSNGYSAKSKYFYVTNPAPSEGAETCIERLRVDDKDKRQWSLLHSFMELAGKEESTAYGMFHNESLAFRKDTCEYYYACHTYPNGLSEFIGIAHEDSVTYLVHANSSEPGLCVGNWGKQIWLSEQEFKDEVMKERVFLGVWVHDEATDVLLNTAKVTTLDADDNKVDLTEPIVNNTSAYGGTYRYFCSVLRRNYYKIIIEAEGYEPAYGEMTVQPDEQQKQIHIYLKPKSGKLH